MNEAPAPEAGGGGGGNGIATPAAPPPDTPPASSADERLSALSEQHRALTVTHARKERELAHLRQQLEQASGRLDPSAAVSLEALRADPLGELAKHGMTFDRLAQMVVDSDKPPPSAEVVRVQQLEQTIEQLREQLGGVEKKHQTREQMERRTQRLSSVKQFTTGKDDFAVVNAMGLHEALIDAIEAEEQANGALGNEGAAEFIATKERELRSSIEQQVKALAAVPWARELFLSATKSADAVPGQQASDAQQAEDKPDRKARKGRRTAVTNAETQTATPQETRSSASHQARLDRAAARVRQRQAARAQGA